MNVCAWNSVDDDRRGRADQNGWRENPRIGLNPPPPEPSSSHFLTFTEHTGHPLTAADIGDCGDVNRDDQTKKRVCKATKTNKPKESENSKTCGIKHHMKKVGKNDRVEKSRGREGQGYVGIIVESGIL